MKASEQRDNGTFSPAVNTRGMICTFKEGIVLRSTYYVFELYNKMQNNCIDFWSCAGDDGNLTGHLPENAGIKQSSGAGVRNDLWEDPSDKEMIDIAATADDFAQKISIAVVNKDPDNRRTISFLMDREFRDVEMFTVNGPDKDSFNTVGRTEVSIRKGECSISEDGKMISATLEPHSVNVVTTFSCY